MSRKRKPRVVPPCCSTCKKRKAAVKAAEQAILDTEKICLAVMMDAMQMAARYAKWDPFIKKTEEALKKLQEGQTAKLTWEFNHLGASQEPGGHGNEINP